VRLREERDAGGDEPQRSWDVGDRREPFGELPACGLVAADELRRAQHQDRPDDDAEDPDPARSGGGLREGDAGERGPGAARAEPGQHLARRPAQNVGGVEASGEQRERGVEAERDGDQQ